MGSVLFGGVVRAEATCGPAVALDEPARPRRGPVSYPGQDLGPLFALIPQFTEGLPPVALRIGVVENATVLVQPGHDGVVIDARGMVTEQSCYFSDVWQKRRFEGGAIEVGGDEIALESLFISFDSAWFNYYHWLCFGIGPAAVAMQVLDPGIPIGVPDYGDRLPIHPVSFKPPVYEQSLELAGPGERIMRLRRGVYRVRRAYVMYVEGGESNQLTIHPAINRAFRRMATQVVPEAVKRRIFVSRLKQGANGRITPEEDALFERLSGARGFSKVFLEDLSFREQVRLFAESEAVLAPHGGGLVNALFAGPGMRLIELNRRIDAGPELRPWFYVISEGAGQRYALLNGDAGDFTEARVCGCFDRLGL